MCLCAQPCPTLCNPVDSSPPGASVHWIFQARTTGVSFHFRLQEIFPAKGSNPRFLCLLHWQMDSLPQSYLENKKAMFYFNSNLSLSLSGIWLVLLTMNFSWVCLYHWQCHSLYFFFPFKFFFIFFFSWKLITLQYCSGFCHTLTWISHGFTCIPHPDPPSHLPLYPLPLSLPRAPGPSTCLMHPTWAGDLFHPG